MSLRYKPYKDKLAVFGDRKKYGIIMKNLGGRWNSRMGGEAGWNIPKNKEGELKKLIK